MLRVIIHSFILKICKEREVSRSERSMRGILDEIDKEKCAMATRVAES